MLQSLGEHVYIHIYTYTHIYIYIYIHIYMYIHMYTKHLPIYIYIYMYTRRLPWITPERSHTYTYTYTYIYVYTYVYVYTYIYVYVYIYVWLLLYTRRLPIYIYICIYMYNIYIQGVFFGSRQRAVTHWPLQSLRDTPATYRNRSLENITCAVCCSHSSRLLPGVTQGSRHIYMYICGAHQTSSHIRVKLDR